MTSASPHLTAGVTRRALPRRPTGTGPLPFRVLAAEDHPVNQVVLRSILEQAGLSVVMVGDGVEAVEACACAVWDLVLMDIQMPRMDGVQASRMIRQREAELQLKRTPILAVTANVMPEQVAIYRDAGLDGVVAKPIDVDALMRQIGGYMPA